jgi:hypothetical protein
VEVLAEPTLDNSSNHVPDIPRLYGTTVDYCTAMRTSFFAENASIFQSIRLLINVEPVDETAVTRDMPTWGKRKGSVEQIETDLAHKRGYKARKECFVVVQRL